MPLQHGKPLPHGAATIDDLLRLHGVRLTAQRVAIASYVFDVDGHLTADEVFTGVCKRAPQASRATVYNTLARFVEAGLLAEVRIDGVARYDTEVRPHHHLITDAGDIVDIAADQLSVEGVERLQGFEVDDVSVVLRGRRRARQDPKKS